MIATAASVEAKKVRRGRAEFYLTAGKMYAAKNKLHAILGAQRGGQFAALPVCWASRSVV